MNPDFQTTTPLEPPGRSPSSARISRPGGSSLRWLKAAMHPQMPFGSPLAWFIVAMVQAMWWVTVFFIGGLQ